MLFINCILIKRELSKWKKRPSCSPFFSMVFAYYKRLTASQKRAYDKSDGVTSIRIPNASELHPLVNALETALKKEDRKETEILSQKVVSALTARLKVPAIRVKVLAVRPHDSRGELHGLYNPCYRTSSCNYGYMDAYGTAKKSGCL